MIVQTEIYNFKAAVNNFVYSYGGKYTVICGRTYIFMAKTEKGETISIEMKNIHLLENMIMANSFSDYFLDMYYIFDMFEYMYNCDMNPKEKSMEYIALVWCVANDLCEKLKITNVSPTLLSSVFNVAIKCINGEKVYPYICVGGNIIEIGDAMSRITKKIKENKYDLVDRVLLRRILE